MEAVTGADCATSDKSATIDQKAITAPVEPPQLDVPRVKRTIAQIKGLLRELEKLTAPIERD